MFARHRAELDNFELAGVRFGEKRQPLADFAAADRMTEPRARSLHDVPDIALPAQVVPEFRSVKVFEFESRLPSPLAERGDGAQVARDTARRRPHGSGGGMAPPEVAGTVNGGHG